METATFLRGAECGKRRVVTDLADVKTSSDITGACMAKGLVNLLKVVAFHTNSWPTLAGLKEKDLNLLFLSTQH